MIAQLDRFKSLEKQIVASKHCLFIARAVLNYYVDILQKIYVS